MEIKLWETILAFSHGGYLDKRTGTFYTHEPVEPEWRSPLSLEDCVRMTNDFERYEKIPILSGLPLDIRFAKLHGISDGELQEYGVEPGDEYNMYIDESHREDPYSEREIKILRSIRDRIRERGLYRRYDMHSRDFGISLILDWAKEKGYNIIDDIGYVQRQLDGDDLDYMDC